MLKTFSITDIGKKRKINQDYVFTSEQPIGNLPNIFIVADGMGGHNAGDYASKVTVETMIKEISQDSEKTPTVILEKAIEAANETVRRHAYEKEELRGMGTTVVAATCIEKCVYVANVGDSRLYIIGNEVKQITEDHSLVEEMVRRGILRKEEARIHPDKNIITKAIGVKEGAEPDFFSAEITEGELILMCSDGLTNMLEEEEIRKIVKAEGSIEEKAKKLVERANENGGVDNITVILIEPFAY